MFRTRFGRAKPPSQETPCVLDFGVLDRILLLSLVIQNYPGPEGDSIDLFVKVEIDTRGSHSAFRCHLTTKLLAFIDSTVHFHFHFRYRSVSGAQAEPGLPSLGPSHSAKATGSAATAICKFLR